MKHASMGINETIRQHLPDFRWTSSQINRNTITIAHTDSNNQGASSVIRLGDFQNGAFYVQNDAGQAFRTLPAPGRMMLFDGAKAHDSTVVKGNRYSTFAVQRNSAIDLTKEEKQRLIVLGVTALFAQEQAGSGLEGDAMLWGQPIPEVTEAEAEDMFTEDEGPVDNGAEGIPTAEQTRNLKAEACMLEHMLLERMLGHVVEEPLESHRYTVADAEASNRRKSTSNYSISCGHHG